MRHSRFPSATAAMAAIAPFPLDSLAQKGHTRQEILGDWGSGGFWLFLLVIALFGAFGGVIYELLILKGRLELPHRAEPDTEPVEGTLARHLYDLGTLARVLIGAAAAIVVVWLLGLEGNGSTAVIAGSTLAGATGIAVFRSLQDRLVAMLATRDLARTQEQAAAQTRKIEEAGTQLEQLKGRLASRSAPPNARGGISLSLEPDPAAAGLPELDHISRLLGEARALGVAATRDFAGSVRERVLEIVAGWAGVDFSAVLPESQAIVAVWNRSPDNPAPDEGILSVLIRNLRDAFPEARINLSPGDLQGNVGTVAQLADYVEARA